MTFTRWLAQLDGGSDAADHAAAADRREHGFDIRQVFENLQVPSCLAGNDLFVVIGRNDHVAVLRCEFFGLSCRPHCPDLPARSLLPAPLLPRV